ncbi:MAG TPA: hypothetical protein VGN09_14955 [Vicinamibacteria bacterium]|jgi:hypothetical protein
MRKVRSALLFLSVLTFCGGVAAADRRHAPWRDIGHEVSVRVWPVTGIKDTWSWDFRNDGVEAIRYLEFRYVARSADGATLIRTDVVPRELRPGQVVGGWMAFMAESTSEPTIAIKEVNKRGARSSRR